MLVRDWMKTEVISADAEAGMDTAVKLLKNHHIGMLPVLHRGELVGVVSDRDIKKHSASGATSLDIHELIYLISKIRVSEIMTRNPITVKADYTVEETAEILLKNRISGAPVTDDNGKLIGIITKSDIFQLLISLSGQPKRGIQFAVKLKNRSGAIQELLDIFRAYGGRIMNVLVSLESGEEEYLTAYIRMYGIDRARFSALKQELREKAVLIYIMDYPENRREIYSAPE
ncbi:MAG: CBS and ACT domain-containing protein [Desulfococcaceae bacterium]|nr:CBS and ACT domain-containing protein [Desulfococcaceae bacterium]